VHPSCPGVVKASASCSKTNDRGDDQVGEEKRDAYYDD
jgi:hypothetical protein